jgi:ribonuclease P protein component
MLPRASRVGSKLFAILLAKGRSVYTDHLSIRFGLFAKGEPQISFVVSKKVSKTAVTRNRLRRQASAAMKPLYRRLPKQFSAIVFFKPTASSIPTVELASELENLLSRAVSSC